MQGLHKKVQALAKQKDCEVVGKWEKSIINHLYWCVASTPSGNETIIKAKWLSLDNHLHNVHRGHSKDFPKCLHGRLRRRDNKKWLKKHTCSYMHHVATTINILSLYADTKPSEKLTPLLTNANLTKDIGRLCPSYQTSSLESYHSVVNHFAPKSTAFPYLGMECRCITCLHNYA